MMPQTRLGAFLIHFFFSFLIFLVLMYFLLYVWFPGFFFESDGGWQGIRIIVAVDLVLGPLLTLVVYKKGKKGLRLDLSIIAIIQIICLSVGTMIVFERRPATLVYTEHAFFSVSHEFYQSKNIDTNQLKGSSPKIVIATSPSDPFEKSDFLNELKQKGRSLRSNIPGYINFADNFQVILDHPSNRIASDFQKVNDKEKVKQWFQKTDWLESTTIFIPLFSTYQRFYVGIDETTGQLSQYPLLIKPPYYDNEK